MAADVLSDSEERTGRHTKSRILRFFLVALSLSSHPIHMFLPLHTFSTPSAPVPVSLSYSQSVLCTLHGYIDWKTSSQLPTLFPFHPSATYFAPPIFFLRIYSYIRGKEFDSVVHRFGRVLRGCVEEKEFLYQRAFWKWRFSSTRWCWAIWILRYLC